MANGRHRARPCELGLVPSRVEVWSVPSMKHAPTAGLTRLALLLVAIGFAGCTSGKSDAARTRNEATATGAVGGAALGAGIGALTSKNKAQGALAGAGMGAVAGGLAGAAAGEAVVKKKAAFISREDFFSRRISLVERQTAERRKVNASLRSTVATQQKRLAELKASGAAANSAGWLELRKSAASEIAAVDRRARTWQETIESHKAFVEKYHAAARGTQLEPNVVSLDAERTELLRQRGQLEIIAAGPRK